jgi:hypothetical protein
MEDHNFRQAKSTTRLSGLDRERNLTDAARPASSSLIQICGENLCHAVKAPEKTFLPWTPAQIIPVVCQRQCRSGSGPVLYIRGF